MERGRERRITWLKGKALLAEIALLLLQTSKTTARSTPLGTCSKSIHTDLDISWIKASLLALMSTPTRPLLTGETELTEGEVGGCGLHGFGKSWGIAGPCWRVLCHPPCSAPRGQLVSALQGSSPARVKGGCAWAHTSQPCGRESNEHEW